MMFSNFFSSISEILLFVYQGHLESIDMDPMLLESLIYQVQAVYLVEFLQLLEDCLRSKE